MINSNELEDTRRINIPLSDDDRWWVKTRTEENKHGSQDGYTDEEGEGEES